MKTNSQRLISLDVFRGLTMAAMIIVNNPGTWKYVYPPLEHAEWHGWTPTDLIFPFFLFIVGVSIKLSLDKYLKLGLPKHALLPHIFRRSVILFVFGLILYAFPKFDFSTMRIPGVLQRIAVCYFIISLIYLSNVKMVGDKLFFSPKFMIGLGLGLLVVYYGLMQFVPVPGYGAGLWDSKEYNLASYVDRMVFGAHVWQGTKAWDPEGLISTIPSLSTTICGVLCAWWVRLQHQNNLQKVSMLLVAGSAGILLGYLLNIIVPINKNLWTPSFVFLTSGFASLILGICMWLVDVRGWKAWAKPFLVLGSNAILVYFLSSLGSTFYEAIIKVHGQSLNIFLFKNVFEPVFGSYLGSFMFAFVYLLFWLAIMWIFYRKRIFLKV